METLAPAKKAWMLWLLLQDLEALLWEIYHEPFSQFFHQETQQDREDDT